MLGPAAEEYQNAAHAKKGLAKRATMGLGFVSFHDWIDGALPDDEWPFLLRKLKPPIDFFKSLGLGDALSDSDECATLNLDKYLARRSEAAAYAFAQEEARIFGEASGHTSATSRKRGMGD